MVCTGFSRRSFLAGSAAFTAAAMVPRTSSLAAAPDPRFLFVVLRGAMDGLAAVAPIGDPAYASVRDGMLVPDAGAGAGLPLDGFFALNPNLPTLGALYRRGEAVIVHAAATPYRERSHFDGQDVLETGLAGPGRSTGWLNRALGLLPVAGRVESRAVSLAPSAPVVLQGPAPIIGWIPPGFAPASDAAVARLIDICRHSDPELAMALEGGIEADVVLGGEAAFARSVGQVAEAGNVPQRYRDILETAEAAARFLSGPTGPRIGVLEIQGWDTHAAEGVVEGRLAQNLRALDLVFARLEAGLAPVWKDTVIVAATEFGRTVRINGSQGTDHGTATTAFLAGGAVRGGRVIADWPGLRDADLYEGRDLKPTTDLRAVFKAVLAEHLGADGPALDQAIFPDSAGIGPMRGLFA